MKALAPTIIVGYEPKSLPADVNGQCCNLTEKVGWSMSDVLTAEQSRAARALLDWSQEEMAKASHLGLSTIRDFEKGRRKPGHNNLAGMRRALEEAGVIFIAANGDGVGVRLKGQRTDT